MQLTILLVFATSGISEISRLLFSMLVFTLTNTVIIQRLFSNPVENKNKLILN